MDAGAPDTVKSKDLECLDKVPSHAEIGTTDAVFGEITEDGPNYRSLGWISTSIVMMKSMIGLGVLSIPAAFDVLGLIPGIICLLVIATITTWSSYVVGTFKLNHREIYSIDDVGYKLFGVFGRGFFASAFCIYWFCVSGSGMLSVSIALNAVSKHGTCTAVFVAVAAIVAFMLCSIRTLGKITWFAWIGLFSILTAILTVTIAVGVQDRPASAPTTGPWESDYELFKKPSFLEAISAISSLVFAYAGTPGFFAIVAEMREPQHYARSLAICQSVVTATYISIGVVVYYYCGSYVASPALGSAGPLMKKVAYGIGIPGLLASTVIVSHLPSKFIFVSLMRGTRHLNANSFKHWAIWLSCTFGATMIAYIIASAIPVFNSLVSLIGALLGTLMSFQPMGCMWLYDNWKSDRHERTRRWYFMVMWSGFVILSGMFLMVAGTYGSVVEIINNYKESGGSAAWSCADNSNSV
ncbi:putative amino acid transporter (Mtr) [Aspergillus homomorphus CBS 101889]|uniref:Transmembrane amino acid transporter n=1 Tax=Aspergillus homomorphus (strain CBS 101889) TaxID=1450537 RepID=A0A395HIU8_ASPHC|nr:transmembrane amino acid transporter [Aspergillus homomorphus CBS 101889]RAL07363.1 transmembrane amino acid transporter [Aspergillus homomorphus CBS 101889]